jgi:putative SOS response-associated peptidase YedK
MCGRFVLKAPFSELVKLYNITNIGVNLEPRYNIAPTLDIAVVRSNPETGRTLDMLRWGLVPWWAKDTKIGYSTINAKAETIATKPAFRDAFKARRCIIPADAFYEWKKLDAKRKQPYAIVPKDGGVFSFAGLWERWKDKTSGETLRTCTIITTEPNELCAPIHNRMPAILPPEAWGPWLGEKDSPCDELLKLLRPYPAQQMRAYPIGAKVGNVKNEGAELLEPIAAL